MQQGEEQTLALVNKKQREERLSLCNECEFYWKGLCKRCGCSLRVKSIFLNQKCPEGKWNNLCP